MHAELITTVRSVPRLWVETLWILESLESEEPIREISLEKGLNLILSAPVEGSTGHGVGKTAFCQLLRFVLEDPQWAAGSPLRDELLHSLPDGAVAARVHLNGEAWTVLKPWKHQKQYRAAKGATWQQLSKNEVQNEHATYLQSLHDDLIAILPVRQLPGSNQAIQWQHVLAWCSRDQNSRYQGYFHWRPEGVGFTLPAQSPGILIKIVLGLLKDASTLERLRKQEQLFRQAEMDLTVLERQPNDLLLHVTTQLSRWLDAPKDSPFRSTPMFDETSLLARAKQRSDGYMIELNQAAARQSRLESDRADALERRAPLAKEIARTQNQVAQLNALLAGNTKEVERLRNQPESLQQLLPKLCEPGNVLYKECRFVVERATIEQFDRAQDLATRTKWQEERRAELVIQQERFKELQDALAPIEKELEQVTQEVEAVTSERLAIMRDSQRLHDAIEDCEQYEDIVSGRSSWPKIAEKKSSLFAAENEVQRLKVQVKDEQEAHKQRHREINALVDSIAKQLPGFRWGVFDQDKNPPFHIGPMHSTTFSVLETLTGDLVCLLDSVNSGSLHPGFLVHDSPREAEMSEAVLWALLTVVGKYARERQSAFQYIVTTSTAAPKAFESFVRVALTTKDTDGLLFRRRIGAEEQPLSL